VPGIRIETFFPRHHVSVWGSRFRPFLKFEDRHYAVSGFRPYADSGLRLMLNPDPEFFVSAVPMIFADPRPKFF
jgi:hypothetical protein